MNWTLVTEKTIETDNVKPTALIETPNRTPTPSPTKEVPCLMNGSDNKFADDKAETNDSHENGLTVSEQNYDSKIENLSVVEKNPKEVTQEKEATKQIRM